MRWSVRWPRGPEGSPVGGGGLLLARLPLAGDRATRALAGAGVGVGALAVDGQAAAVPQALVAAALDLAADVGRDLTAEVTLDVVVRVDVLEPLDEVVLGDVADADVGADTGLRERLLRPGAADAVDVGEGDLDPLLAGEINAGEACHGCGSCCISRRSYETPGSLASDQRWQPPWRPGVPSSVVFRVA